MPGAGAVPARRPGRAGGLWRRRSGRRRPDLGRIAPLPRCAADSPGPGVARLGAGPVVRAGSGRRPGRPRGAAALRGIPVVRPAVAAVLPARPRAVPVGDRRPGTLGAALAGSPGPGGGRARAGPAGGPDGDPAPAAGRPQPAPAPAHRGLALPTGGTRRDHRPGHGHRGASPAAHQQRPRREHRRAGALVAPAAGGLRVPQLAGPGGRDRGPLRRRAGVLPQRRGSGGPEPASRRCHRGGPLGDRRAVGRAGPAAGAGCPTRRRPLCARRPGAGRLPAAGLAEGGGRRPGGVGPGPGAGLRPAVERLDPVVVSARAIRGTPPGVRGRRGSVQDGGEGMRLVVTGGSSFVGAHICRVAALRGHEVFALHHSTRLQLNGVTPVRVDLRRARDVEVLRRLDADAVLHVACRIRARGAKGEDPAEAALRTNTAMMDAVLALGRPVVYASSTVVHWKQDTPYALSRRRDERRLAESGLPWAVVRPSAPYGPRLVNHRPRHRESFHTLAAVVRHSPVVPVIGDGRYRRQPVHVEDLAAAMLALVEQGLPGRSFDAGGAEALSFNEIIDTLARAMKCRVRKLHLPKALFVRLAGWSADFDPALIAAVDEDELADPSDLEAATGVAMRPFSEGVRDLR
ncbi:MAG: NAD-dependent epimerase/dehydratase family protein [Deltaproteobacteria bacterium]|nr:MAG: NAD-dependent epimerase/dehydratase family protein [Deltaproteobacteria bacterium]